MAQEAVCHLGCFESDDPQIFHVPNRGWPSAMPGGLEARGAALWRLDKVHISGNGLDGKSTVQRSPTLPWDVL